MVHSCFKATGAASDVEIIGEGFSLCGILGSRISSPFKRTNIKEASMHQFPPRVTRSDERKDDSPPSMRGFAKCKNADELRDSVAGPGEGGVPLRIPRKAPVLLLRPPNRLQGLRIPRIDEGGRSSYEHLELPRRHHRQGQQKEGDEEELKKRHQLLLFLWSVEGSQMARVSPHEPPDNNFFDTRAQEVMTKLNKEETPAKEEPEATIEDEQKSSNESSHDSSKGSSASPANRSGHATKRGHSLKKRPMSLPTENPSRNFSPKEETEEGERKGKEEKEEAIRAPAPRVATLVPATQPKGTRETPPNRLHPEKQDLDLPGTDPDPTGNPLPSRGPGRPRQSRSGTTTATSPLVGDPRHGSQGQTNLPRALAPTNPAATLMTRAALGPPDPRRRPESEPKRRGTAVGKRESSTRTEEERGEETLLPLVKVETSRRR